MKDTVPATSEAGRTLAALGSKKGGDARAAALTPDERQDIARQAAEVRWNRQGVERLPQAEWGSPDRPLRIGDREIPCFVLDDRTRVIAMTGMLRALDMSLGGKVRGGEDRLTRFATSKSLESFISEDLLKRIRRPIKFRAPRRGSVVYGYEATILADLCDAVLAARKANALRPQQEHIAAQCEILLRAVARVGIIALVDEATGYQEVRDRLALQAILDKYLRKEFAAWAKRFPDEFYTHIFRLRGWTWKGMTVNRPQIVANYTKNIVYARLAPGILRELEARNIKDERGYRKAAHHQWLTEDIGHPALAQHLYAVIGLMRIADSWGEFKRMLDKAYPKRGDSLQMELFDSPAGC